MKKIVLLAILALLVSGCGSSPKAEIASAKYVETINASGVFYRFEGKDNIQIKLDFTFDKDMVSGLDPASEDYRKELFAILAEAAHFYHDGEEVERTWGYWPEEAGNSFAKGMSLFYVVPSGHAADSLRFVFDGSVLGEGASGIDTTIRPDK